MLNSPQGRSASSVMISQKYFLEAENIMLSGQWHCRYASGSSFIISFCFQTFFFLILFWWACKSWLQIICYILLITLMGWGLKCRKLLAQIPSIFTDSSALVDTNLCGCLTQKFPFSGSSSLLVVPSWKHLIDCASVSGVEFGAIRFS